MFVKKSILTSLLIVGISSVPFVAQAAALTIHNNTNEDSTSIIQNPITRLCSSTVLGTAGITYAHSTNTVSEGNIDTACWYDKKNCIAEVYMTNDCSGPIMAIVTFDTTLGISNVDMKTDLYKVTGGGFEITLDYKTDHKSNK